MAIRAAVQTADRTIEIREFDLPKTRGEGALLRIEGCGVCGSDVEAFRGSTVAAGFSSYPYVPGHEPVGRVEWIHDDTAAAWGVRPGDRIAVEPFVACGVCNRCSAGEPRSCRRRFVYSCVPLDISPGLWGGFAEVMALRPGTIVHRVPEHVSVEDAVLFNPLGAGFDWVCRVAGTTVGESILIFGPGQRGLACAMAAAEVGAAKIIVAGLSRHRRLLELARSFGATHSIDADAEDVAERVAEITDGEMADRVVDTTPGATQPVVDALRAVRRGGTVVLAGSKEGRPVPDFVCDTLIHKELTLRGALGVSSWAFRQALHLIGSSRYPLARLHTHTLPIDRLGQAISLLAGEIPGQAALHITIVPRSAE